MVTTYTKQIILDKEGGGINKLNPLPIIDISNNSPSLNSVFGEKLIGQRIPYISAQFQYPVDTREVTTTIVGSGSLSYSESMIVGQTGTDSDGSVIVQSKKYVRYIPGHETYCFFTTVFVPPKADSYQRMGLFDGDNGFYIGYEGTDFVYARVRDGTTYKTVVDPNNVYEGFDPQKGNIYYITYGFLGFAPITFRVIKPDKTFVNIGVIEYPNSETVTNVTQTFLPFRAEVTNDGNTSNITLKSGSISAGLIDGGGNDVGVRRFSKSFENITISSGDYNLVTFRNKTSYGGIENRVNARLILFTANTDLSKNATFRFIQDATITNTPTWIDKDTDNSVIEYSTDATITASSGETIIPFNLSKVDSIFKNTGDSEILIRPGETMSILLNTDAGATGTVTIGLRWEELF